MRYLLIIFSLFFYLTIILADTNLSWKYGEDKSHTVDHINQFKIDSLKNKLVSSNNNYDKCKLFQGLAILYHDSSDFEKAMKYHNKILVYKNALITNGHEKLLYSTYHSIAQIYEIWGEDNKALEYFNLTLEYCYANNSLDMSWPCPSAVIASSFIRIDHHSDNYDKVISELDFIIESSSKTDYYPDLTHAVLTKSHILLIELDDCATLPCKEDADNDGTSENQQITYQYHHSDKHNAEDYYDDIIIDLNKVIKICEDNQWREDNDLFVKDLAYGYSLLAFAYENKGEFINAIKYYKKAIDIRKTKHNDYNGLQKDSYYLARLYYYQQDYDNSIKYVKQSIEYIDFLLSSLPDDDQLSIQYFSELTNSHYLLIDNYFELKDYDNMFEEIKKSKSRQLNLKLSEYIVNIPVIGEQIMIYEGPNLYELIGSVRQDEAYIIFSKALEIDEYICLVLTKNKTKALKINVGYDFEVDVKLYLGQIKNPNSENSYKKQSNQFYKKLIEPIEAYIENKKNINFFLVSYLSLIPMETLINNEGYFFIQGHNDIRYFPSIDTKYHLEQRIYNYTNKNIIIFGDPRYDKKFNNSNEMALNTNSIRSMINKENDYSGLYALQGYNFPELPHSRTETNTITSIFSGNSTYFVQEDATEDQIKELSKNESLKDFSIIHFATHGMNYISYPDLSSIILSQYDNLELKEDGFLTKKDISSLKIESDLVVMSCCETGLGEIYDGEGIINLSYSFFKAGSNATISTLWPIYDESTSIFIGNYYKNIRDNDYSKALIEIKKDFINGKYGDDYRHPSYWGGFIYYGI